MKYVTQNGALFSLSEKNWNRYCKEMASGTEVELPGKLLEFDLIEISKWDRENYMLAAGLKEMPSDLPKDRPAKRKITTKSTKISRRASKKGT